MAKRIFSLLKVKEFLSYDIEWLDFILECREESNIFSEGIADLHCREAKYLAQELMLEYGIM